METYKGKINEFVEWVGGKDVITENNVTDGLDVSGGSIRNLIQEHLRKPFYPYEDKEYGLYRMFSSQDAFNIWYNDKENNSDLELFNFVRPSDYEIDTDLTADPRYIMSGNEDSIDSKIIYHWDVKNNNGSYADSISATYTVTTQDNKVSTFSEIYNSTQKDVSVDVYKYLDYGLNTVNVKLRATSTGATLSVSFVITVIKLTLSSNFAFNERHIYGETFRIPVLLIRNDASKSCSIFFYIDETQVKKIDIPVNSSLEYSSTITDIVNTYAASSAQNRHVVHNLQIYAQTEYNGVTFRSNILYYTFETASADAIANYFINVANSFNTGIPPFSSFQLSGTQYLPITLLWGYYTDQLQKDTSVSIDWKLLNDNQYTDIATITANSGRQSQDLVFIPNDSTYTESFLIAEYNNSEIIRIPITISESSLSIYETSLYNIKMSAFGRTNTSIDKNTWTFDQVSTTFTGILWNDNSGWSNNSFRVSGVDQYATISYNPFYGDPSNGRTIEFEFESEKVSDSDDIILILGNPEGARIEVTPDSASLYSADGVSRIHTNFKSNERTKLAFIINEESNDPDSNLLYIINNGILERAAQGNFNFASATGYIKIGGSNSGIRFYSYRVYPRAITYTDEYNNYVFDSENKSTIVRNNNVIDTNSRQIDYNLCSNKIDTILISGNLNKILDSGNLKDESLTDVTIERFCPFDTTKNFKCENCQIRKHGQSTLNYPISSMKFWLNKNTVGGTPIFTCEAQAPLGLSKNRYKMKDNSIPGNKFILQANYADSSGVHNGGLQRLIQNTWYNAVIDGEYKLRTAPQLFATNQTVTHNSVELGEDGTVDGLNAENKQWGDYFNKDFPYTIEVAADSIPCVVFYKNTEGDNRNTFLGQYVLMEDKKSDFNFGERSIYKAAANDPFCLTVAHKSDDKKVNKIWDNDDVLRIEVLNMNNNFTSYMSTTDTHGTGFEDIVYDSNQNPLHYRWEEDFEMIYPDPDDLLGDSSKNTDKFGSQSKFLSKAEPFIDWFKWLVSTYNNEQLFISQAAQHLDLYKMAAYYIFMLRCGLTDSGERNAQIKTYDGIHFHYEPWDMDIAFGNKNTGGIAFNPPVDRNTKIPGSTTYAISGRSDTTSNWLWDALEAWPYWINVIVPKVAQALYLAGLTYDNMMDMFDGQYADKWCEILYNESGYFKYIEAVRDEPKLEWLQGARVGHRHWWTSRSMDYYDAKWSVGDFRTHNIYIAANHVQDINANDVITIIPTSPTYVALIQNDTPITIPGVDNPIFTDKYSPALFDISGLTLQYKVPFYVRGASYIESIDLSCLAKELDIVRFGSAYSNVSGAPLKEVDLGCPVSATGDSNVYTGCINAFDLNLSVMSDQGDNSFENLETLNLRGLKERLFGMYKLREYDLSLLKNVLAMGGQYSSFYSSRSGNNFINLELPGKTENTHGDSISVFTTLDLNNTSFENIAFWDTIVDDNNLTVITKTHRTVNGTDDFTLNIPQSLNTVRFTGTTCQNVESKQFVQNWIDCIKADEENIGDKTLILENINWSSSPVTYEFIEDLAKFNGGNNKPQDGTMSGYIVLSGQALTSQQLSQIRSWFGESVFNKNSSGLVIDQQLDYVRINVGADAVVSDNDVYLSEGKSASLNATKFSLAEDDTQYNWFIREPGTQNNSSVYKSTSIYEQDGIWYIKASESNNNNYDVEILCTGGAESTTMTIHIITATYSEFTLSGIGEGFIDDSFGREGINVQFTIHPVNSYTASILSVKYSLLRENDQQLLLNSAIVPAIGLVDQPQLDEYLQYAWGNRSNYGIVFSSTAVPLDETVYKYILSVSIQFKSGVTKTAIYRFNLLDNTTPILSNDASYLYNAMLDKYRNQVGDVTASPSRGIFYRSTLLKLTGSLSFENYTSIESLRTLTNESILRYVPNITSLSFSGCSSLTSTNQNISSNGGVQLVFNNMPNLESLNIYGCSTLDDRYDIDLSSCANINSVDTRGTTVNVIFPQNATITSCKLGTPKSIAIENPASMGIYSATVLDSSLITSLTFTNIPDNKSFTVFDALISTVGTIGHLKIELNNIEELVSMNCIEKLYNIATGTLDASSNLKGRLTSEKAYLDATTYLNQTFSDLYITAQYYYIRFENSTVAAFCKNLWGDSDGVSTANAASVKNIYIANSGSFSSVNVSDISWLLYFTGAESLGLSGQANNTFADCTNITNVVFPPNIRNITGGAIAGGNIAGYIGCFARCSGIQNLVIPEGLNTVGSCAFFWCNNILTIDLPSTLTAIGLLAFNADATQLNTKYIICRAATPPALENTNSFGSRTNTAYVYVPDTSVAAYQGATNWSSFSARIKPLSDFETDAAENNW